MNVKVEHTNISNLEEIKNRLIKEGYSGIYTWCDSPGTFYDWHTHTYDEVRWVYEGSVIIGHEGGQVELKPGDKMEIKAGTRHWAKTETGVCYVCGSKK